MKIVVNINAPIYGSLTLNFSEIGKQININAENVTMLSSRNNLFLSAPPSASSNRLGEAIPSTEQMLGWARASEARDPSRSNKEWLACLERLAR